MKTPTSIYLASAIDQSFNPALYTHACLALECSGYVVYDPRKAFIVDPALLQNSEAPECDTAAKFIYNTNQQALHSADLRVFVVEAGVASWGVPIELFDTVSKGLPFLLVMEYDTVIPAYLRVILSSCNAHKAFPDEEPKVIGQLYSRVSKHTNIVIWSFGGTACR